MGTDGGVAVTAAGCTWNHTFHWHDRDYDLIDHLLILVGKPGVASMTMEDNDKYSPMMCIVGGGGMAGRWRLG